MLLKWSEIGELINKQRRLNKGQNLWLLWSRTTLVKALTNWISKQIVTNITNQKTYLTTKSVHISFPDHWSLCVSIQLYQKIFTNSQIVNLLWALLSFFSFLSEMIFGLGLGNMITQIIQQGKRTSDRSGTLTYKDTFQVARNMWVSIIWTKQVGSD